MPPKALQRNWGALAAVFAAALIGARIPAAAPGGSPPAHVTADALIQADGTPKDVFAACGLPEPPQDAEPAWAWWCGWPAPLPSAASEHPEQWQNVRAFSDRPGVSAFAVRGSYTVLVFVVNGGQDPVKFSIRVRLPAGAYTAERLTFATRDAETVPRVDGLESVVLGRTGFAWKMGALAGERAALYRFTNRSVELQGTFRAVKDGLRAELAHSRGPCRRILGALRECEDNVALLAHISPARRDEAVREVDRALLTLGQAQSLFRNFRDRGSLSRRGADRIAAAMDQLEQALAQTASACLNVVPEMAEEDPGEEHVRTIAITTANAGGRSLSFVKLGITAPQGARVWPREEAGIPALAPGQSATAQFRVRFAGPVDLNAIQGSVTYVARRTPIHLWVRNYWPPKVEDRPKTEPPDKAPQTIDGKEVP
ncbi:MAG: hypothetical protein ACP5VE_07945 [Chthonomonadales bacterium]